MRVGIQVNHSTPWVSINLSDEEMEIMKKIIQERIDKFRSEMIHKYHFEEPYLIESIYKYHAEVGDDASMDQTTNLNIKFNESMNILAKHPDRINKMNTTFNTAIALLIGSWIDNIIQGMKEK